MARSITATGRTAPAGVNVEPGLFATLPVSPVYDGDEVKARVKRAGSDELDLNIREEADPARVRPRDDAGDASDVRHLLLLAREAFRAEC